MNNSNNNKSKNSETLLRSIGAASDNKIAESNPQGSGGGNIQTVSTWKRAVPFAACLALVVGATVLALNGFFSNGDNQFGVGNPDDTQPAAVTTTADPSEQTVTETPVFTEDEHEWVLTRSRQFFLTFARMFYNDEANVQAQHPESFPLYYYDLDGDGIPELFIEAPGMDRVLSVYTYRHGSGVAFGEDSAYDDKPTREGMTLRDSAGVIVGEVVFAGEMFTGQAFFKGQEGVYGYSLAGPFGWGGSIRYELIDGELVSTLARDDNFGFEIRGELDSDSNPTYSYFVHGEEVSEDVYEEKLAWYFSEENVVLPPSDGTLIDDIDSLYTAAINPYSEYEFGDYIAYETFADIHEEWLKFVPSDIVESGGEFWGYVFENGGAHRNRDAIATDMENVEHIKMVQFSMSFKHKELHSLDVGGGHVQMPSYAHLTITDFNEDDVEDFPYPERLANTPPEKDYTGRSFTWQVGKRFYWLHFMRLAEQEQAEVEEMVNRWYAELIAR